MVTIFHLAQLLLGFSEREIEKIGLVVQLVRIPACHAGGRGFESRPYRRTFERKNIRFDSLAQQVEHNTFNVGVPGSSPGGFTKINEQQITSAAFFLYIHCCDVK